MHNKTLLLTPWYFPIKIIRWQDAVKMVYEGTVDVVVEYDEEIASPSVTWLKPAVIRLKKMRVSRKRGVKFSRMNVYTRDNFVCQYCTKKFPARMLTYDHVIPRAAGGKTCWENIVTACSTCNTKKADMTCDESGMFPLNPPVRPKSLPLTAPVISVENAPSEWQDFLQAMPA